MADRLACCVPFCNRTTRNDRGYAVWICADHWRMTDKQRRKLYHRAKRKGHSRKAEWHWSWLREQAIERAAGI